MSAGIKIRVRQINEKDILRILWYERDLFAIPKSDSERARWVRTRWKGIEEDIKSGRGVVADFSSSFAGFATYRMEHDSVYISKLFVLPYFRGLGVGRLLLLNVGEKAVDSGANRAWLRLPCYASNTNPEDARRFYKKFGFKPEAGEGGGCDKMHHPNLTELLADYYDRV